jgi:hypothetical protein
MALFGPARGFGRVREDDAEVAETPHQERG